MTTTRFLFILFLLLNILFLAASRGWLGFGSSGDSSRISIELNPERVKVLGPTPLPEVAQANVQANVQVALNLSPEDLDQPTCLAWTGLSAAQNNKLISLFSAAGIQTATRDVQAVSSWRVRVPPLPTREAAEILTDNMAELGVEKSAVQIEEVGNNKFAIVIGESFRSRQGAERYLETIKAKGVSAGIEARNISERRVEATVGKKKAEDLLNGQPFAKRYKSCSS